MTTTDDSPHTFVGALKDAMQRYATFSDRSSRAQFWWFNLWYFLILFAVMLLEMLLFKGMTMGLLVTIAMLALFLPMLAVSVRRLHDTDRSGWWILINFVPFVGYLIFLYFMVMPGTDGSNRFGTPP